MSLLFMCVSSAYEPEAGNSLWAPKIHGRDMHRGVCESLLSVLMNQEKRKTKYHYRKPPPKASFSRKQSSESFSNIRYSEMALSKIFFCWER